jgi:hypothetical protein
MSCFSERGHGIVALLKAHKAGDAAEAHQVIVGAMPLLASLSITSELAMPDITLDSYTAGMS